MNLEKIAALQGKVARIMYIGLHFSSFPRDQNIEFL